MLMESGIILGSWLTGLHFVLSSLKNCTYFCPICGVLVASILPLPRLATPRGVFVWPRPCPRTETLPHHRPQKTVVPCIINLSFPHAVSKSFSVSLLSCSDSKSSLWAYEVSLMSLSVEAFIAEVTSIAENRRFWAIFAYKRNQTLVAYRKYHVRKLKTMVWCKLWFDWSTA